jgi:hypothetical protein
MLPAYLEFEPPQPARFERLVAVFDRLKRVKEQEAWPEVETWLELLGPAVCARSSRRLAVGWSLNGERDAFFPA